MESPASTLQGSISAARPQGAAGQGRRLRAAAVEGREFYEGNLAVMDNFIKNVIVRRICQQKS